MPQHKQSARLLFLIFMGSLALLSCEEDALEVSPGSIHVFNFGDSLQFSANLDVAWNLSTDIAGNISTEGLFVAGDSVGAYTLEVVSKKDETNRQTLKLFVSNRSEDIKSLLTGGNVMYLRHAVARVGGDLFDLGPDNWHRSCSADTARQISPEGYVQAQEIGQAFRNLEIPFEDTVYVSEYCRCIQTVEELELELAVKTQEEITFYVYNEAERHAKTQAFINSFTPTDKNVLIVSHSFGVGNTYQQPEQGYTVVFQKGNTEPVFKTIIRDDEFTQLK